MCHDICYMSSVDEGVRNIFYIYNCICEDKEDSKISQTPLVFLCFTYLHIKIIVGIFEKSCI